MEVIASARPSPAPFSAGLKVNGFVFLSGQRGFLPETGKIVARAAHPQ